MSSQSHRRIAVIGGGVLGASSAYHLARSGAKVFLVTEGPLASGASGRSLSWLNSAGIRSEHYHRLRMVGIDRYRTLFAREPNRNWLRFDGGLSWHSADEADLLTEIHDHELSRGYDSQLLSPSEVAGRIPGVNPAAIPASGARWNPGEGWVDLPSLINHLASELLRLGGELIINAGEASVVAHAGRATGVTMAGQDHIEVDAVLLATGAKVPQMVARFGVRIPDATPLALLVRTGPVQSGLRAVLNTPRASIRPTPEGALAVDSDWTVPYLKEQGDGSYSVGSDVVEQLLAEASRVLAGTPHLSVASQGIGLKPIPADGEPVLGQLGDIGGLYVAFTHSGATLALIVGELLGYEITTGQRHPLLAAFTTDRFG